MVDSSDRERISEARNELHRILSDVSKLIISEKIICLLVNIRRIFHYNLSPFDEFHFLDHSKFHAEHEDQYLHSHFHFAE